MKKWMKYSLVALVLLGVLTAWKVKGAYYRSTGSVVYFYAWDAANSVPKTGLGAAELVAYVSIDGASPPVALGDTSATEVHLTNAPGSYVFTVAASEITGQVNHFSCKSTVANIYCAPVTISPTARPDL